MQIDGTPCEKNGNAKAKKLMIIVDGPCWHCQGKMKIVYLMSSNWGMLRGHSNKLPPSQFIEEELQFARSKGVILKVQFSKTRQESYLANTCNNCGNFAGEFKLFDDYIYPASIGELQEQTFEIGEICEECSS